MAPTQVASNNEKTSVLTPATLLEQWQGHRRLTRRVIDAFPEDKLFSFSLGGMRPFSEMALEFVSMAEPIAHGVATGKWIESKPAPPKTKAELLALWDQATASLNTIWPTIPAHRFEEVDKAFGQWESTGIGTILYAIDNEVHHRGQGYVYLRALNITPPEFYNRS
jgi:uncharacterized damage-inducible protein DinB